MFYLMAIIGGLVPVFLLSLLFSRFLFNKPFGRKLETNNKIIYSVIVAFIVTTIISGFGNMNGGSFNPMILEYFFSSLLVLSLRLIYASLRKPKNKIENKDITS